MQDLGFGGFVVDGDYLNAVANGLTSERVVQVDAHLVLVEIEDRTRQGFAVFVRELDDQAALELELRVELDARQRAEQALVDRTESEIGVRAVCAAGYSW